VTSSTLDPKPRLPSAAARDSGSSLSGDVPLKGEVFDRFQHGLLVLDADGAILLSNREGARILDVVGIQRDRTTCCEALGCRELGGDCLTELAIKEAGGAFETRRDLKTEIGTQAIWVSAFSIGADPVRILLQLRRGDVHDRRFRANPQWRTTRKLRITTLGRTSIASGGAAMEGDWLDKRAGQLLRYLVVRRGRTVTADEIGESLWRDANYSIAGNVRTCVHRLRAELEPCRSNRQAPDYLLTHGGSYCLNADRVEIDADEFEAHTTAGLRLASADATIAACELERGLKLYGGEFLAEIPFAEWALAERRRLHELACGGLRALSRIHRTNGCTESAAQWLERLAGLQPLDEAVCRELVELDMLEGRGSDAKRRYDRLCRMMDDALGYQPSFTLAELANTNV
jgi:DNA-binding SARP family transcriptional activator